MKITFEINIETLADVIASLNKRAKAKLLYLLENRDDKELHKRKDDIESGKIKKLKHEDIFGVH